MYICVYMCAWYYCCLGDQHCDYMQSDKKIKVDFTKQKISSSVPNPDIQSD